MPVRLETTFFDPALGRIASAPTEPNERRQRLPGKGIQMKTDVTLEAPPAEVLLNLESSLESSAGPWCRPEVFVSARFKLIAQDPNAVEESILASSILVVDDNEANALLVKEILGSAGFKNVFSETQPGQVVTRIRDLKPDLIALDLQMLEITGLEIMASMASEESLHDGPLLVLTADTSPETKRKALDLGADDLLTKPVDSTDLCIRVSNLLAGYKLRKQLEEQKNHLLEMVEVRTAELELTNKSLELEMSVRKEADTLLRNAEQRLRFLLTSSPTSIFSANPNPPYAVTFISDNVQTQLGYSADEFTSNPNFWMDHIHPEDSGSYWKQMPLLLAKGHFTTECRFLHKDNTYRWMQSDRAVILDSAGVPTELVGAWMDISDRKASEEALAKTAIELSAANARLQQFDKLKSDFVSTASHEMRTPLTVIREFADLLSDGAAGATPEDRAECHEAILRNCDRLTKMLDYLLDFQRIEAGKLTLRRDKVNAIDVLRRCHKDLMPKCTGHGITFNLEVSPDLPFVLADEQQVVQVIVNLIGNAVKFTPKGGTVTLKAVPLDGFVKISVEDTGRGIAPENLESVFEAFRQIDRVDGPGFRGTGLGLTISNHIVKMHEGDITVESTLGVGTTFSFTLPQWSETGGLQALVYDKWEDCDGAVFLLFVRLVSDAVVDLPLAALAIATKAELRAFDNGIVLPGHGCVAFVLECDRVGITSAVERLSKELSNHTTDQAGITINVIEISEKHKIPEVLLDALRFNESDNLNGE